MEVETLNIKIRNIRFQFDEVPKHWIMGNPVLTHFINSMHVVFPEGEKFFIKSIRKYSKAVQSESLKKDMQSFCAQEGIHAREHERFWEVLEHQGLQPQKFSNFLNTYFFKHKYSIEHLAINILNEIQSELGDKVALSVTAALEHYTAILAHAIFQEPIFSNEKMAPQMLEMLHWHAAEELEHKAVCFDVLKEIDDSEILKIFGMLSASLMIFTLIGAGQVYFIAQDKDISWKKMPGYLSEFSEKIIFGEIGKGLAKNFFKYFRSDFHPHQIKDFHFIDTFFSDKSYG